MYVFMRAFVHVFMHACMFVCFYVGDNIDTAKAIATECGILTEGDIPTYVYNMHAHTYMHTYHACNIHTYIYFYTQLGGLAMEGPDFRRCVCMYVCMYVCMFGCMRVCMHAYIHTRM